MTTQSGPNTVVVDPVVVVGVGRHAVERPYLGLTVLRRPPTRDDVGPAILVEVTGCPRSPGYPQVGELVPPPRAGLRTEREKRRR